MQQGIIPAIKPQTKRIIYLCLFWTTGFGVGLLLAAPNLDHLSSSIRLTAAGQSSIIGLLAAAIVPFLLSVISVKARLKFLLYIAAFMKALFLAFTSYLVYNAFGSAGWLVASFYTFADAICCVALFTFWCKICITDGIDHRAALIYLSVLLFAVLSDYYIISPFFATLIIC